ncbi:hypothetical protein GCM10010169_05230 [Micromonospora fulviviridis]|uniref:hypothetical protein n=1 Tax=Micromonospora fulviviridis TaxID=47860 RepID=UPI00166576AF|nr:hypothetical protein [Micromonospora fulviviridis]GGR65006.1 hypothetical protein GCM10010169_05230 [Micromonospora fulviviridis]
MLPVAFASSLWTATLRRIARTAVTALALIAGLTGPAVTPADHLHPAATARPAVDLRVDAPVALGVAPAGPRVAEAAGVRPAAPAVDSPVRHPLAAPAGAGTPQRATADAAAPVAGRDVVLAADPGRAANARRGPPRA